MGNDTVIQLMAESKNKNERFLAAWKDAVRLIGPAYFKGTVPTATSKEDLAPDYPIFVSRLGTASSGERLFMLAVYQFYNDTEFKSRPSLTDLAWTLDEDRLDVLVRLMRNYSGW